MYLRDNPAILIHFTNSPSLWTVLETIIWILFRKMLSRVDWKRRRAECFDWKLTSCRSLIWLFWAFTEISNIGIHPLIFMLIDLFVYNPTISVILVTGGNPGSNYKSAELLKEDGSQLCKLPNLPDDRRDHSQSGLTSCGGADTQTSCVTLVSGQWTTSHTLQHSRYGHSTWMSSQGLVLIGGWPSSRTTELLNNNGGSSPSFELKYRTT